MKGFDYSTGEVPDRELPPELRSEPPAIQLDEGRTDRANAARLVYLHGNDIRYVGPWRKWIVWTGQQWVIDDTLRLQAMAKEVSEHLFDKIDVKDCTPSQLGFARRSANAGAIDAMIRLAADEVAIRPDALDGNLWLFNVQNGTIDLKNGLAREFKRDDMITRLSPVVFNSKAECPLWLAFLNRIFDGNEEIIRYVQRLVGYFLTGDVGEHILPVFHGTGANGKSTLVETLAALLGEDYCCKAPKELFVESQEHKTMIADLFGRRLAYTEETGESDRLAEGRVKDLTGGGAVKARRMREDYWQFKPTHKLLLCTNHRPSIRGTDTGIWRRIKLVPFDVTIPESERDKSLGEKLIGELSGILNWAIEGCLAWQAEGLAEPERVKMATDEYQKSSDEIGEFLNDFCVTGPAMIVSATQMFECYRDNGGQRPQKEFSNLIEARGFNKQRMSSGSMRNKVCFRGVGLLTETTD